MADLTRNYRDKLFISKATPADDNFVLWLAPRLEAAGYKVFADITCLETGDDWRTRIVDTLRNDSIKLLLCCSDATLNRDGVKKEIGIAADMRKELNDSNFILPLRLEPYKEVYEIVGLQYQDFSKGWAEGLVKLLETLEHQKIPRGAVGSISKNWALERRKYGAAIVRKQEILNTNWLRIVQMPDEIFRIEPTKPVDFEKIRKLAKSCSVPLVAFRRGFITFASPRDIEEHFAVVGPFETVSSMLFSEFTGEKSTRLGVASHLAGNIFHDLIRQAWDNYLSQCGYLRHEYANGVGFHVSEQIAKIGEYVKWNHQGVPRKSMLRNESKKRQKVWEYGVSAIPSLFPYPHLKLKARVLFSQLSPSEKSNSINDHRAQHRLRKSMCSGWRNPVWNGKLMAFVKKLSGENPFFELPLGAGVSVTLDSMPIQVISPVTAGQINQLNQFDEENDETRIIGHIDEDEA